MAGKRRRTAEEAKAIILETAAARLREHGLEGLNITGVAEAAGMTHATLIHHFGSSGEMREALANKMTLELINDLVQAMGANVSPAELARNVFSALAEGGHAKLLAWRAVEGNLAPDYQTQVRELFDQLLEKTQDVIEVDSREDLQRIIMLVATAAIGYGLAGEVLIDVLGMSEETVQGFPSWVAQNVN